jgi:hypothetical protein
MRKFIGLAIVLGLAATPAFAQKIHIDYAHDFDFKGIKTFTYVDTPDSNAQNPLMASRIEALIKKELKEGGKEVVEDGDIYITYHITTEDKTSYSTTSVGYGGYGGYWGGWGGWGGYGGGGMATSTTTAHNYTDGTLIIDAYDSKEKKMIWRATGTVTVKDNPEKQNKQVEKIFKKIGDKWDKILAGEGK